MSTNADAIPSLLKTHGLRVTLARVTVLELLMCQRNPLSHQQIEDLLDGHHAKMDRVTIYRTLHSLTDCGLLHKVMGIDRSFSYAYKTNVEENVHHGADHPHFVCERCAHTFCLTELDVPTTVNIRAGFSTRHTEVKLYGYCPECN